MDTSDVSGFTFAVNRSATFAIEGAEPDISKSKHVIAESLVSSVNDILQVPVRRVFLNWQDLHVEAVLPAPTCFSKIRTALFQQNGDARSAGSFRKSILQKGKIFFLDNLHGHVFPRTNFISSAK